MISYYYHYYQKIIISFNYFCLSKFQQHPLVIAYTVRYLKKKGMCRNLKLDSIPRRSIIMTLTQSIIIAFHKQKQFNEKSARRIWGNSGSFIVYTCVQPKLKEIKNTTICIHDSQINVSGLLPICSGLKKSVIQ